MDVLSIEDSSEDVQLSQEASKDANASIRLHLAGGGVEAMLRREGIYADAPKPDFIVLKMNLPKMGGREVLTHIAGLKAIPTVILTIPDHEAEVARGYQLQAHCYLNKTVQLDAFESIGNINQYWLIDASCRRSKANDWDRQS